ncbi:MAG: hypothetical protein HPY78_07630 [Brevinematales bacterium]|nr:hypothetical protein [Brevinematales bacterium]
MRKGVAFLSIVSVLWITASGFGAIQKKLIHFPTFEQNIAKVVEKDNAIREQASNVINLADYGYPTVKFTGSDWALSNWRIILAPSANTTKNNVLSYTKPVKSKKWESEGGTVLGARIHFIQGRFLSWALIKPPFDIFAYYDDRSFVNAEGGEENSLVMGLLANVGQIKSISTWVYGLNYQMQVGIRLRDRMDQTRDYFMGSVWFEGWRKLLWQNPEYTDDVRDRVLQRIPLYPRSYPYVVFDSYIVYKPEIEQGGDFVIYFKDIDMEFDRAIIREEMDIDDEAQWGILAKERLDRRILELKRLSDIQQLYEQAKAQQRANAPAK